MLVLGGTQNTDKIPLSVDRQVSRGLQKGRQIQRERIIHGRFQQVLRREN